MTHLLEYCLLVSAISISLTYVCVKVLSQVEQSKCTDIKCCGMVCKRNLDVDARTVDIEAPKAHN